MVVLSLSGIFRSAIALVVGAVAAQSHAALAQDTLATDLPGECTLESVAGAFGFNEDTGSSPGARENRAFIGIIDLRDDGTAFYQRRGFQERGGEVRVGQLLEGEWSVEPNCFGEIDFPEVNAPSGGTVELDFAFVAVENATELFFIANNPLEEGDAKLLFRR